MGEEEKAGAALIHQKNRQAEYQAFAEWIKRSAADPNLRALPKANGDELAKPKRPDEVIRHARKDRLLESFENTIWALRFRCMSCHIEGTDENRKLVEKHGQRVAWFKKGGAQATLDYLLSNKRLIDVEEPRASLLLLKPLNEVEHGGGKKMLKGDQGYHLFLSFLEDFARIKKDQYADARSLPRTDGTLRFGSEAWFKITNTLPAWGDRILQVDIHAWDAAANAWEAKPIATSDRLVWGKGKLWQHNLTLLADKGSRRAQAWKEGRPALSRGRYLVKVYVDADERLTKAPIGILGPKDFVGQCEVISAWPDGYGRMTVVDAAAFRGSMRD
jgi:hypothetical protein